ncbi:MAG TPA: response regulator [Bryobacteraceae bacterium]|nr:response regulator [Bryobacteraceae bacterium]
MATLTERCVAWDWRVDEPTGLQPKTEPSRPASIDNSANAVPAAASGTETILIVEDEDGVRRLLERVLARRGFRVLAAAGGEEALRLFAQHGSEIQLVLTDVMMPGMDGQALADQLWVREPATRVLFMSGYTGDVLLRTGPLESSTAFLRKPVRAETLTTAVRTALDSPSRPFNPR